MSLFYNILSEQKDLLKSKGYDEADLNSPYKQGWFMRELEIGFSLVSNEAHKINEKLDFEIKAIGFFEGEKDIVIFLFNYEYEPGTLCLSIKSLTANFDTKTKTYELKKNEDLPAAKDVHKELNQLERMNRAKFIANHTGISTKRKL